VETADSSCRASYRVKTALANGFGYAVSNGLYRKLAGSAAWIIEGKDLINCIIGTIHTPGVGANHSAFRSEAAGLSGIVLTIMALQDTRNSLPRFRIACDGKSVLLWIQSN